MADALAEALEVLPEAVADRVLWEKRTDEARTAFAAELWRDRGNGCYESLVSRGLALWDANGDTDGLLAALDRGEDWGEWLTNQGV